MVRVEFRSVRGWRSVPCSILHTLRPTKYEQNVCLCHVRILISLGNVEYDPSIMRIWVVNSFWISFLIISLLGIYDCSFPTEVCDFLTNYYKISSTIKLNHETLSNLIRIIIIQVFNLFDRLSLDFFLILSEIRISKLYQHSVREKYLVYLIM